MRNCSLALGLIVQLGVRYDVSALHIDEKRRCACAIEANPADACHDIAGNGVKGALESILPPTGPSVRFRSGISLLGLVNDTRVGSNHSCSASGRSEIDPEHVVHGGV